MRGWDTIGHLISMPRATPMQRYLTLKRSSRTRGIVSRQLFPNEAWQMSTTNDGNQVNLFQRNLNKRIPGHHVQDPWWILTAQVRLTSSSTVKMLGRNTRVLLPGNLGQRIKGRLS